jgi:CBS domain-containing protein
MLCSELMKRDVERCLEGSLVTEAAVLMRDRNVGFLPVSADDGAAVGTITDRDIALRVLAHRRPPDRTRVDEVMTHEVVSCNADDELAAAEQLMMKFQKSRIVCTDSARRIVGVISLSDIARIGRRGHAGSIAASLAMREAAARANPPRARVRSTRCGDLMDPNVARCAPEQIVPEIAEMMRAHNLGFIPICNEQGAVVGTVTDRDLVLRVVAAGLPAETTKASDVLTRQVVHCSPDDPLSVAEELMVARKKSRVVCIDANGRPVGVISFSDIARVERFRRVSRILRDVTSRPAAAA